MGLLDLMFDRMLAVYMSMIFKWILYLIFVNIIIYSIILKLILFVVYRMWFVTATACYGN